MDPIEERVIDVVEPVDSIRSDSFGIDAWPLLALCQLVGLLDDIGEMEQFIEFPEPWVRQFNTSRDALQ